MASDMQIRLEEGQQHPREENREFVCGSQSKIKGDVVFGELFPFTLTPRGRV